MCVCRLHYLDKHLPGGMMPQSRSEEWQSLFTYRNSLSQGDGEVHPITLKQATQRRYANKRKQIDGGSYLQSLIKKLLRNKTYA